MTSTFFGLEIARRALSTTQLQMDIAGHNVANAQTPGYSRQVGNLQATQPYAAPGLYNAVEAGQLGTGVDMVSVTRQRNAFLDTQFRQNQQQNSYWTTQQSTIQNLEQLVNEPSTSGLKEIMDGFFSSWNDLSKNPSDPASRAVVLEQGQQLAGAFNQLLSGIGAGQSALNDSANAAATEVNTLATSISELNQQIQQSAAQGDTPNDLMDQRDQLVDKLSQYMGVTVTQSGQAYNVSVQDASGNSYLLVSGGEAGKIASTGANAYTIVAAGDTSSTGSNFAPAGGSLQAYSDGYNYLAARANDVSTFEQSLVNAINTQHQAGYDASGTAGTAFFNLSGTGVNASMSMAITDGSKIAASSSATNLNDGGNALSMSDIIQAWPPGVTPAPTASSPDTQYNAFVASLGVDGQQATTRVQASNALLQQVTTQRQEVSGVSINDEVSNMVQAQQSYNAAAQVISILNQMLSTLDQAVR